MFWKFNATSSSQIDSLLAKEDVTLQEVLDSEDIINECRVQNKNLIDFLLRPDVMEELVTLTTREPSTEISEQTRFKYPNIASELLTCDVPAINERLAGDERLLKKLYEFLEIEPPLNPLLASYFSKIMGGLIAKKTEQNWLSYQLTCLQVLDFLKARDTFLPLLIKHLGTSAIMDLMLKLMTQVEGVEMRQNILNWLDSQRIIQQLVCMLNPKIEKERHDNVAQLLCDFLRTARDTQRSCTERADPDPLLNTLESPETLKLLLDQMFDKDKCESSIVGGISVLLALLDVNQTRSAASICNIYSSNINYEAVDMEQKQKIVRTTTEAIASRMKDFHDLLLEPPKQSPVVTTTGTLDPPVGHTRLKVVVMLSTLVSSDYGQLHEQLINLGTFTVLLDLFFRYPWNNFLHTQVENSIIAVLAAGTSEESGKSGTISPLCRHLIDNCNLIERILKAWKENNEQEAEKKSVRRGYMGHLISLLSEIVEFKQSTALGDLLKELKPETAAALDEFKYTCLDEVLEQQKKLLGGLHPSNLIEDNDEYGESYPHNSALQQQNFSQYQMQNLPSQYIEGFNGFNDDAFNDGDDTLQTIDNPSDINFDLGESEMMQRDALFKQVCAQSINTLFDAEDQIFEDRDHTFQTVIEKKDQGDIAEGSSDSDDGSPSGGEDNMEVDPWLSPKGDPWSRPIAGTTSDNATSSSGWADFSSAAFVETRAFASVSQDHSLEKMEEHETKRDSEPSRTADISQVDQSKSSEESMVSEGCAKSDKDQVERAAAGDHPDLEDMTAKGGENSVESQPSMSLEGDTCKPADKPVEKSPDMPLKTEQETV